MHLLPQLIIFLDDGLAILHLLFEFEFGGGDFLLKERDGLLITVKQGSDYVQGELVLDGLINFIVEAHHFGSQVLLVLEDEIGGVFVLHAHPLALLPDKLLALIGLISQLIRQLEN